MKGKANSLETFAVHQLPNSGQRSEQLVLPNIQLHFGHLGKQRGLGLFRSVGNKPERYPSCPQSLDSVGSSIGRPITDVNRAGKVKHQGTNSVIVEFSR